MLTSSAWSFSLRCHYWLLSAIAHHHTWASEVDNDSVFGSYYGLAAGLGHEMALPREGWFVRLLRGWLFTLIADTSSEGRGNCSVGQFTHPFSSCTDNPFHGLLEGLVIFNHRYHKLAQVLLVVLGEEGPETLVDASDSHHDLGSP